MELNERIIKITGSANIVDELEISHDYDITLKCNCINENKIDNQNGTYDMIYKLKIHSEMQVIDKGGKILKALPKNQRTKSQHLRLKIQQLWDMEFKEQYESEQFYEMYMDKFIDHIRKRIYGEYDKISEE